MLKLANVRSKWIAAIFSYGFRSQVHARRLGEARNETVQLVRVLRTGIGGVIVLGIKRQNEKKNSLKT